MSKRKEKIMPFFKFLAIAMAIITIITLCLFKFIDILPGEYFLVLCVLLILFDVIFSCLILTRKGVKKKGSRNSFIDSLHHFTSTYNYL